MTDFAAYVSGCESKPEKRNLSQVRKLASARDKYTQAVEVMQKVEGCQGVIARLGGLLTWHTGEELAVGAD